MRNVRGRRYRRAVASTAQRLVAVGWPVVPGAWWSPTERRHRCDLGSCVNSAVHPAPVGCHDGAVCAPGWADLTRYALANSDQVRQRWAHRPYTVLLVTGAVVDVLDAPPPVGDALLQHLRGTGRSGMAAHVAGRTLLFLAAGPPVDHDTLDRWRRTGVLLHQRGSWVAVPPSVIGGSPARWTPRRRRTGVGPLPPLAALLPVLDRRRPRPRPHDPPRLRPDEPTRSQPEHRPGQSPETRLARGVVPMPATPPDPDPPSTKETTRRRLR